MLKKSKKSSRRKPEDRRNGQDVNRRNFLRLESLEARLALTAFAGNDVFHTGIDEPLAVSSPGVLANDVGATGMPMSASLFSGPANGQLTFNTDGSFNYTPNAGFEGMDSFVYYANDTEANSLLAAVTINVSEGTAPASVDDVFALSEDEALVIPGVAGVLANDDAGAAATVTLISGPASGELTLAADGGFNYVPEAEFSGEVSFTYQATNSVGVGNVATVTLSIAAVNDVPVATNDSYTMDEDGALAATTSVLANDSDVEGSTLTPQLESQPLNGTVTFNADGTFNYTPNANFNGLDDFSYLVSDGTDSSEVATVTISVNAVNDLPVGGNDEYTIDEDATLTVDAAGVLANDTDLDNTSLTAELVIEPQHGSLTLNADGSFVFTPEANFSGLDGFSYQVNDGEGISDVVAVTINVAPINDAPIATNDEYTTPEDTELVIDVPGVMLNDSDPDGDPMTVQVVSQPQHGTMSLAADGRLVYTPEANYSGIDGFSYTVTDGTLTSEVATATINVTPVNDAPSSSADAYSVDEDNPLTVSTGGILDNDSDLEGAALTATLVSGPASGTLTLNPDGTFEYVPNADFHGEDSFVYTATDGELAGSETTVTITVAPVNDKPLAEDDSYSTDENMPLTVDPAGVLANDSDVDSDPLTASIIDGPANGAVTLNADGSFVYTPNPGFAGTDTFTYAANDASDAATATVTIVVNDVIQPPAAAEDMYNVGEDIALDVSAAWGLLANDVDPQGLALSAEVVTPPEHGELVLDASGSFRYVPAANWNGVDTFTYRATNSSGEVTEGTAQITVEAINDAPSAMDDSFSVSAGGELTTDAAAGVQANDSDIDSSALTAKLVKGPQHGTLVFNTDGSFTYTPAEGYIGSDEFTYQLNDGMTNSIVAHASISVTGDIGGENAPPVGGADSFSLSQDETLTVDAPGVLANDTDADSNPLTAQMLTSAANGTVTLAADGSFVYVPNAGFVGSDSFTYAPHDGAVMGEPITVTLEVAAIGENTRPIAHNDHYEVTADTPLSVDANGVLGNDHDAENDALTAEFFGGPQHGTVVLNGDGSFTYTPEAGYIGVDSFLYRITDGELYSPLAAVTLRVSPAQGNLIGEDPLPDHSHDDDNQGAIDCILAEGSFQFWS